MQFRLSGDSRPLLVEVVVEGEALGSWSWRCQELDLGDANFFTVRDALTSATDQLAQLGLEPVPEGA